MNPVTVFRNMHQELTHTYNLPLPAVICVKGLSAIHWVWWFYRKKEMVKPENIVPAALGTILDGGLKFTPNIIEQSIRGIAKLILIATRIDKSILGIQSLTQAFTQLQNACTSKFSPVIEPQWIKHPESMVFSIKTVNHWKNFGRDYIAYIRRIYHCVLRIFVKTFKLSMRLWDTYHAFVFSHDDIPELFVNSMYWYQKSQNNKDYINTKLEEYRPLIQKIFDATHLPASADNLICKTKIILDNATKGIECVENGKNFVDKNIVSEGKKVVHTIKQTFTGKDERPLTHTPFVLRHK